MEKLSAKLTLLTEEGAPAHCESWGLMPVEFELVRAADGVWENHHEVTAMLFVPREWESDSMGFEDAWVNIAGFRIEPEGHEPVEGKLTVCYTVRRGDTLCYAPGRLSVTRDQLAEASAQPG